MSIFAYYNHKNNCLNLIVKALLEVDGYCNRFVIIINHLNRFAKQKWQLLIASFVMQNWLLIIAIFAYYNCFLNC
jgi:hypothetical protein